MGMQWTVRPEMTVELRNWDSTIPNKGGLAWWPGAPLCLFSIKAVSHSSAYSVNGFTLTIFLT